MAQGDDFVEYELNLALNFKFALEKAALNTLFISVQFSPKREIRDI